MANKTCAIRGMSVAGGALPNDVQFILDVDIEIDVDIDRLATDIVSGQSWRVAFQGTLRALDPKYLRKLDLECKMGTPVRVKYSEVKTFGAGYRTKAARGAKATADNYTLKLRAINEKEGKSAVIGTLMKDLGEQQAVCERYYAKLFPNG